jgi:amino acid adenylation domain-containing protein
VGRITEKAGITHVVCDEGLMNTAERLTAFGVTRTIPVSRLPMPDAGAPLPPLLPEAPLLADDLAWILFTSGSTGDPKGIMISHRAAWTFIDWMKTEFQVTDEDRVFSRAPLQFDLSVFDIYSTFMAGGTLVIADLAFENKPEAIVSLMREERITVVYTVPSAYIAWLTKGDLARDIPTLRWLLYAGEPFPTPYLRRVMQCLPTTSVSNIYGPTETNIVTYHHLHTPPLTDDPIPIGRPVHDTEAYIVDKGLREVPAGEMGEILIRGGTVFSGYFNNPKLTAERLVQSPFHSHPTLCCRTGDYGRLLPDGTIAYHGRMDNMVKTRGYRVELGEVESAIAALPLVGEVAVIPKAHEKYGNTLHAFIGTKGDHTGEDMRAELSRRIPSYMVPYEFILTSELPKTATGKVDRVKLAQSLR